MIDQMEIRMRGEWKKAHGKKGQCMLEETLWSAQLPAYMQGLFDFIGERVEGCLKMVWCFESLSLWPYFSSHK